MTTLVSGKSLILYLLSIFCSKFSVERYKCSSSIKNVPSLSADVPFKISVDLTPEFDTSSRKSVIEFFLKY